MPIPSTEQAATTRPPVLTRTAIGQKFRGVTCLMPERRDRTKVDPSTKQSVPMLKPNGKARQELVVTMLTMKSTMPVGNLDNRAMPAEGDVVRVILKGKSYGDWIDAGKDLGFEIGVGYLVEMDTTHAQAYDEDGNALGGEITTQEAADAVPRGRSLGYYGPLTVREAATPEEIAWDTKATKFYNDAERPEAPAASTPSVDEF